MPGLDIPIITDRTRHLNIQALECSNVWMGWLYPKRNRMDNALPGLERAIDEAGDVYVRPSLPFLYVVLVSSLSSCVTTLSS